MGSLSSTTSSCWRQLRAAINWTRFRISRTKETFVLLRVDEYERRKEEGYDDSPWTREEPQALAWERIKHEDWDEYDDLPEKP